MCFLHLWIFSKRVQDMGRIRFTVRANSSQIASESNISSKAEENPRYIAHPVRARNSEARICATAVRYASIGRRDSIAKQIHSDLRTNRLE